MIKLVIPEDLFGPLECHIASRGHVEEGAFLTVMIGRTASGMRLIGRELVMPEAGDWERSDSDLLRPTAKYVSRAISVALQARAGLLFVHSHPDPDHPAGLSCQDRRSLHALASVIKPMLRAPFGVLAVHPSGWAGEVGTASGVRLIDRVTSLGRILRFHDVHGSVDSSELDARQRPMLGPAHERLRNLRAGVIGAGGIGSPLSEVLARVGVQEVTLVDPDVVDDPSGVRRVFGSSIRDLTETIPRRKVDVVGRHLDGLGLTRVRRLFGDVRETTIVRHLLDCDVLLCTTDSHGSRAILNDLAVAYGVPLLDVGVRAGVDAEGWLAQLVSEVRVVTWDTPCLWCRNVLDGRVIREENLPEADRELLEQEGYTVGRTGRPEPSSAPLTVLAAGQIACALLTLLSDRGREAPSAYLMDALNPFLHVLPEEVSAGCRCRTIAGLGDRAFIGR